MSPSPEPTEPTATFNKKDDDGPPFGGTGPTDLTFTGLNQDIRRQLVDLTSNPASAYLQATTLELSALGANADLSGNWAQSNTANLASWQHTGQGGRLVKTTTVRRGYLFPLGHRAIFTQVYERVVAADPADPATYPIAYLQGIEWIQVMERVKNYPAVGQPFGSLAQAGTTDWPFSTVTMTTLRSPLLSANSPRVVSSSAQAFWPQYGSANEDVLWSFVATDAKGRQIPFQMPLVFFYGNDAAGGSGYINEYEQDTAQFGIAYNEQTTHQRWSYTNGALLQYAPDGPPGPQGQQGATSHNTLMVVVGASNTQGDVNQSTPPADPASAATLQANNQPNFYPVIQSARIRLHAADVITGGAFSDKPPTTNPPVSESPPGGVGGVQFAYYPDYVSYGTSTYGQTSAQVESAGVRKPDGSTAPANPGYVFAKAVNNIPLNMPASSVGGIGTPNLGITGLSAQIGAVGGNLDTYAQNAWAYVNDYFPTELQSTASAAVSQLLGGLNLGDILAGLQLPASASAAPPVQSSGQNSFQIPTVSSWLDPANGVITAHYNLSTPLTAWPATNPIFDPQGDGTLTLNATFTKDPGSGAATYTVNGSLTPFNLYLLAPNSFIQLTFSSVTFTAGSGQSTSVNVDLVDTTFIGALSFVNALEQFVSSLGAGGVSTDVGPTEVTVSASLSPPPVECGILTLTGISFSAGVVIPFLDGPTTATFAFASQQNPFTLTVCMFGGGGFVSLALGFGGVTSVQVQLEFTGQFALDLYVVSGSLTLDAGIYFSYASASGVTLTGFVKLTGQICVLGIITISASMDMSLSYASANNSVVGSASLQASVSICGFSKSVGFTVHKQFEGGGGASSSDSSDAMKAARRRAIDAADRPAISQPAANGINWDSLVTQSAWTTYCAAFGS
jgi:hypothetical protein